MKIRLLDLGAVRMLAHAAMEVRDPGMAAIELTETVLADAQRCATESRMNASMRSPDCHVRPGSAITARFARSGGRRHVKQRQGRGRARAHPLGPTAPFDVA
ncbi:hypothetical protein [Burkholderia pseudomultivorans]|uniref:hypothetical protein n=1 Tax=Burkholderia pseudomultivorans TaxID=1207504 RepID=UPI0009BEAA9F|nr:hypothetical protein [Burkholderia pseudomultivorans]